MKPNDHQVGSTRQAEIVSTSVGAAMASDDHQKSLR